MIVRDKYQPCVRRPHVMSEKRANQYGWCRPKRRPHNLPDTWNTPSIIKTKCWKDRRRTQYRTNGRGKKHTLILYKDNRATWQKIYNFEDYCEAHDIPYNVEVKYNRVKKTKVIRTKKVLAGHKRKFVKKWKNGQFVPDYSHQIGWEPVYKVEKLKKPKYITYTTHYVDHYLLIWWTDKDIDIERVLNG